MFEWTDVRIYHSSEDAEAANINANFIGVNN